MITKIGFPEYKTLVQEIKRDKIEKGSFINKYERTLSAIISWAFIRFMPSLKPNAVSVANVTLMLLVLILPTIFSVADTFQIYLIVFTQFVLFTIGSILEKVDGEIARFKKHFTQAGIYYDLLFHFLYVFSFYLFLGIFFFNLTLNDYFWQFSLLLSFLVTMYKMFGKIRHHIKYKILIENHSSLITDYISRGSRTLSIFRFIDYFFFTQYEWTRIIFLIFIITSIFWPVTISIIYTLFMILLGIITVYRLLFWYPRNALYSEDQL